MVYGRCGSYNIIFIDIYQTQNTILKLRKVHQTSTCLENMNHCNQYGVAGTDSSDINRKYHGEN